MTADSALYIPPYKADDQDVVVELNSRFGAETFVIQPTRTGMPVIWVPRDKLVEVLTFLRQLPKPYVMLYDLHASTSACVPSARACQPPTTVCSITCCRLSGTAMSC